MPSDYPHHVMHHKLHLNDCLWRSDICRTNEMIISIQQRAPMTCILPSSCNLIGVLMNSCQVSQIQIIDTRVLGYGHKLKYKRRRHAARDNVTYDISGPSPAPTYRPLRPGLSLPNHSGMSENNKHAFRASSLSMVNEDKYMLQL